MRTLYDRMKMLTGDRSNVARRLLGKTPMPVPVRRPQVEQLFNAGLLARGMPEAQAQLITSEPRYSPGAAHGLMGLGAFGDITDFGVTWKNNDAYNDWASGLPSGNWRDGGGDWAAVPQSFLNAIRDAVANGANSLSAAGLVDEFLGKAKAVAADMDRLQSFGIGGRSSSQDAAYRSAMQRMKSLVQTYAPRINAVVQREAVESEASAAAAARSGGSVSVGTGIKAGFQRLVGGKTGGGTSALAPTGDGLPILPIVAGLGVAGLLAYMVMSKKKR